MIKSQRETAYEYFPLKQEGNSYSIGHEKGKEASASSISSSLASQWTRLKDPRIVRVSRAFGGKDRHSKVCTVRGLRDRRVRLSVPTAIQLYDLQDRLGLNQPSKVVDWLLNAAKDEIDELPPLPNFPSPAGNFPFSAFPLFNEANNHQLMNINSSSIQLEEGSNSSQQNSIWKVKPREVEISGEMATDRGNYYWMNNSSNNKQGINNEDPPLPSAAHVLPHNINLLPKANHNPSILGLVNTMPIGNYQWETNSSVAINSSSQLGNQGFTFQSSDHINVIRPSPLPSTLSLSTGKNSPIQQLGGEPTTTQSYFPSHDHVTGMEMGQRQINQQYQMLSSSSSSQNPLTNNSLNHPSFSLAMMTAPKFHYSPNNNTKSQDQQGFTHK